MTANATNRGRDDLPYHQSGRFRGDRSGPNSWYCIIEARVQ
jgi:hypothetical protein